MYQYCLCIGNLTEDPVVRPTNGGHQIGNFSIAVDNNDKYTPTTYFKVKVWNKMAESCQEHLHKGSLVLVAGWIASEKYDGAKGPGHNIVINANQVKFLPAGSSTGSRMRPAQPESVEAPDLSDEIPF